MIKARETRNQERKEKDYACQERRWDYGAGIAERERRQKIPIPWSVVSANPRIRQQVEDGGMVGEDIFQLLLFLVN